MSVYSSLYGVFNERDVKIFQRRNQKGDQIGFARSKNLNKKRWQIVQKQVRVAVNQKIEINSLPP